jgi:nucleobase:cation symporter-1, NCS1 family
MTMSAPDGEMRVWEGHRPSHAGDLALETAGMAPVLPTERYARTWWMLPVWFTCNMEVSSLFIGTLGAALRLGFLWGTVALVIGIILGAIPVAIMATWGPRTGTGQVPLARMPFGKSIVVPGLLQWLTAVGWIAIGCFFGGQATCLLLHVPFWAAVLIILATESVIGIVGYELAVQVQKWGAPVMAAFFVLLTAEIFRHRVILPADTVHGQALAGAFVLMTAIAISGSLAWASCASDYSRYLPANTPGRTVFWYTLAGITASYGWLATVGLAGASILGNQTASGINTLMGGKALGDVSLGAIALAAVASSSTNDYSGSLAFQAMGMRLKRPLVSLVAAVLAFVTISWMHAGSTSTRFESILLFTGYGIAPFAAIVLVDWHRNGRAYTPLLLHDALQWRNLNKGLAALAVFVLGFGAMIPFMNTSLVVGPVAEHLHDADLAYPAGFAVTAAIYTTLLRFTRTRENTSSLPDA